MTLADAWKSHLEALSVDQSTVDPKVRAAFYAGAGVALSAFLQRDPDFSKMPAEIMQFAQDLESE